MTHFKPRVGNVKTGQTTGRFTVINPYKNFKFQELKILKVNSQELKFLRIDIYVI